jgi:hypothetical protein
LQVETDVSGTIFVPIIRIDVTTLTMGTEIVDVTTLTMGTEIVDVTTLMMGTEIVPETSVYTCNQLTRLCAREDFTEFCSLH